MRFSELARFTIGPANESVLRPSDLRAMSFQNPDAPGKQSVLLYHQLHQSRSADASARSRGVPNLQLAPVPLNTQQESLLAFQLDVMRPLLLAVAAKVWNLPQRGSVCPYLFVSLPTDVSPLCLPRLQPLPTLIRKMNACEHLLASSLTGLRSHEDYHLVAPPRPGACCSPGPL